ncbi:MAG: hypothetical protein IJE78_05395 [Bacteroidaceae bacterium]|nr:hypothetical protein [Bacteroidaceae bacterium]
MGLKDEVVRVINELDFKPETAVQVNRNDKIIVVVSILVGNPTSLHKHLARNLSSAMNYVPDFDETITPESETRCYRDLANVLEDMIVDKVPGVKLGRTKISVFSGYFAEYSIQVVKYA